MAGSSIQAAKRLRKELQNLQKQQQQQKALQKQRRCGTHGEVGKGVGDGKNGKTSLGSGVDDDDDDIHLECNADNILHWHAWIRPAADTPYSGGVFELDIRCSSDYPLTPPTIKFVTRIFHPNVHFRTGDICLDILKKEWSPAWGIQASCRAILALLSDPDADSPLNCDAGNMIRANDMVAYHSTAMFYTIENAYWIQWPPSSIGATTNMQN
jgi:peroxin-4